MLIHFHFAYSDKESESYTAQNMFALYSSLYNFFDAIQVPVDGIAISIESVSSSSNKQGDSSVIRCSVGLLESEAKTIEEGLVEYLKTSYYEDVIEKDPSFGNTPFEFNKSDMVIDYSTSKSLFMIIIIVAIVFSILSIIIGIGVCKALKLMNKNDMKKEDDKSVVYYLFLNDVLLN